MALPEEMKPVIVRQLAKEVVAERGLARRTVPNT